MKNSGIKLFMVYSNTVKLRTYIVYMNVLNSSVLFIPFKFKSC